MASTTNNNKQGKPAEGERRAVRSLSAQYRVAALLAYEALLAGELEWLRLVDPDAGRLDDVIIARSGRLDAYQIKWSDYRDDVRFKALVSPSKVSGKDYPAPFDLMADGWRRLKAAFPKRRVHAHYLTHDGPSSRDRTPGASMTDHLQAFLRYAFPERAHWLEPGNDIAVAWSGKIDEIVRATGLSGSALAEFLGDCELNLGFELPRPTSPSDGDRAREIETLAGFLMRQASSSHGAVQLSPADIRQAMGWTDRADFRFSHEFPVDEQLYQPIERTIADLEAALAQHPSGYLALVGPPGSGKSTTLTQMLRYREGVRLVRYYAFVRDDPRANRGEAAAFLHDLCLAIQALGVSRRWRFEPVPENLPALRERLGLLLSELAEDARKLGGRAIILIDGLDHIEREQSPVRSLIEELPPPASVPEGVTIILGTQPVALEHATPVLRPIRAQLGDARRTISMAPLSRSAVTSMMKAGLDAAKVEALDAEDVYRASGGHPLSTAYLIKRLGACPDSAAAAAMLEAEPDFSGDVELGYASYWDQLNGDRDVRDLLGLLARIRGSFELATVKRLADPAIIERFVAGARFLFRQLTPTRWAFFHNSFRLFVLAKTSVDAFGEVDPELAKASHRRLAAIAPDPTHKDSRGDLLYHLEQAGDVNAIVGSATQSWFREQFVDGRRLDAIVEDIHRAMRAAAGLGDVVAIVRLLLIHKELGDRDQALKDLDLGDLFVRLRDEEDRANALILGDELLESADVALHWAAYFAGSGDQAFASKLFEAAEPAAQLAGIRSVPLGGDAALEAWAGSAWRFRPLDQLVAAAGQLQQEVSPRTRYPDDGEDHENRVDDDHHDHVRIDCLVRIGAGIQDGATSAELSEYRALLASQPLGAAALLRLDFRAARLGADGDAPVDEAVAAMARVIDAVPADVAGANDCAFFADVITRLPGLAPRLGPYLDKLASPLTVDSLRAPDNAPFQPIEPLFRQARARAALGQALDPSSIPTPEKAWDLGRILFQRLVIVIASVWGEAVASRTLAPDEVVRRLRPVIGFRRRRSREAQDWHDWSSINSASPRFYELALRAAEAHGRDAFKAVLDELIADMRAVRSRGELGWYSSLRRSVVLAAFEIDGDRARTEAMLQELEESLDSGWDVNERLEEYRGRAAAWLQLGSRERARENVQAMVGQSFGIWHHKDRQAQNWADWAVRLLQEDDPRGPEAVRKVLNLVAILFRENRGRGMMDAAGILLEALAVWSPQAALETGTWLIDADAGNRQHVYSVLLAAEISSDNPNRIAEALIAAARLVLPFGDFEDDFGKALRSLSQSPHSNDPGVAVAMEVFRRTAQTTAQSGKLYLDELDDVSPSPRSSDDDEDDHEEPVGLVTADGRSLDQASLEALARQPSSLSAALAGAQPDDGLDWRPVIQNLFAHRSSGWQAAAAAIVDRLRTIPDLELVAAAAASANERAIAEQAAAKAISVGRPYGWASFYDGGSRLGAARCLLAADPANGRARALRLFADDYVQHDLSPADLVSVMDELLVVFADQIPTASLWHEIDEHISGLAELVEASLEPPMLNRGEGS